MAKPSCSRCRKRGSYSSFEEADGELRCICYGVGDASSVYVCHDEYACAERARGQRDAAEAKVARMEALVEEMASALAGSLPTVRAERGEVATTEQIVRALAAYRIWKEKSNGDLDACLHHLRHRADAAEAKVKRVAALIERWRELVTDAVAHNAYQMADHRDVCADELETALVGKA